MSPIENTPRWRTLPPDYVAQPALGGERDGTRWELGRVYDPGGKLDHARTYWEVRQVLADDPAPRSVSYRELPRGVSFADFMRTSTRLAEVEQWIARAARARARASPAAEPAPSGRPVSA